MDAGERDRVGVVATKEVAIVVGLLVWRQAVSQGSFRFTGCDSIDATTTVACLSSVPNGAQTVCKVKRGLNPLPVQIFFGWQPDQQRGRARDNELRSW